MNALVLVVALAQQVLPATPVVRGGFADAREPRTGIGFLVTNLFADPLQDRPGQGFPAGEDVARDTHGTAQFGANFALVRAGPVVVSLQAGVIARFRVEKQDNDALSTDYQVSLPFNFTSGPWAARVRILHRSSHLGDELEQNTSIRRIEFDHEEIDGLMAHSYGAWRVYAGGTWTLASSFAWDKHGVQIGADGAWPLGGGVSALAGIDWQKHSISRGLSQRSATAGLELKGVGGSISLLGRYLAGQSPIGEFFLDRERYWGLSLVLAR